MVTTGYLEHDVAVSGLRLHYQEWGMSSAPAIVMLHGFGVSGHMFDEFAERMEDRYRLIAIDQRGHGDSDWSNEGDYSRDAFVEDLEGFRKALSLDRFILIGHSMGGLNAVSYTVKYPQHIRALILVDVGPEAAKEGVDNIMRFTRGPDELEFEEFVEMAHRFNQRRTLENIRERMRHRLRPTEGGKYTWKFDRRFREPESGLTIGSKLSNDKTWQLFRRISVPVLIVRGGESDVLTQDVAERAAREMQRARLVVVPGAGHSVPGDNPDDFTQAVREFLGDVEHGQFAPTAASEPPPLEQLVEEHEAARRRGPGLVTLVLAGAGAVLALAGVGFVLQRSRNQKKQAKMTPRERAKATAQQAANRLPVNLPELDIEQARRRAVDLVSELSVVGRDGVARARRSLHDVDMTRARSAAQDVVHVLGETTREAPERVRKVVDRRRKKRRGFAGKVRSAAGRAVLTIGAVRAGRMLGSRAQARKGRKQRA